MSLPWETLIALLEARSKIVDAVPDTPVITVAPGSQSSASRLHPKFHMYTAADITGSGFFSSSCMGVTNILPIAHAYNYASATPEELATQIADTFDTMGFERGTGDSGGGLYAGSFFIQNECTGVDDIRYSLFQNENDLIENGTWGSIGNSFQSYQDCTPFWTTFASETSVRSRDLALALKTELDTRGLCYPALRLDDWEAAGHFNVPYAQALKFRDGANNLVTGYMDELLLDSRLGSATDPAIMMRSGDSGIPQNWESLLLEAPSYNTANPFDHATNQAFTNWLAGRLLEAASAALRFGPEMGFRELFPQIRTSVHSVPAVSTHDLGYPNYGLSGSDYSFLRITTRPDYIWQDASGLHLFNKDKVGRIRAAESNSDFWRRTMIESILSTFRSYVTRQFIPIIVPPGTSVLLSNSPTENYTVTEEDVFTVVKACILTGNYEMVFFCPGSPFTGWSAFRALRDRVLHWTHAFFGGGRNGSRTISFGR